MLSQSQKIVTLMVLISICIGLVLYELTQSLLYFSLGMLTTYLIIMSFMIITKKDKFQKTIKYAIE